MGKYDKLHTSLLLITYLYVANNIKLSNVGKTKGVIA